ncbi:MAG: T9SS type B sorting domain-containing protein, partial [Saprospiraceae bacterium]
GLLACDQIKPDTVTYVLCNYDSIKVGNSWFSISNPTGLISMPNTRGYGCDSLILVKTNFLNPTNANLDTTICKGEKLVIHNQTFNENNPTGTIKLFGGNHRGCDSTIQVQLNFYPIAASQLDTSVCTAGKIIIHNQTFDEMHTSGVIVLPGANYTGCDSSIQVNLRILPYSQSNLDMSICTGLYIVLHNQRFDETKLNGQINLSGANQFGCDSIIHVNVNLLPLTTGSIDTSICPGDFVMLYNQRFDESKRNGQIIRYGANEFGCDSIIDIHLSVRPNSTGKLDTSICPGGNVIIHQQIFNEQNKSASIVLNRANQFGCDSTLNVNLRIRPEYHLLDTIESCVEYTWSVNGKNYRTSGSYRFDTVTHEGCDSNYLMQLIIHPEYHFSDTLCALGNFYWSADHRRYEESGVYEFNHRSSSGCDSIEYLVLMIAHEGEVYVPNVFSPNGDQVNDRLVVFSNEDVHMIDLFAIYDRWGELMFEQKNILPNDPQYGWDGMFRGVPVNPDVFVYIVEWRDKARGYHKVTGDATLLR